MSREDRGRTLVEITRRNLGCALHELHVGIGLDQNSVCAAPIPFFHIAGKLQKQAIRSSLGSLPAP